MLNCFTVYDFSGCNCRTVHHCILLTCTGGAQQRRTICSAPPELKTMPGASGWRPRRGPGTGVLDPRTLSLQDTTTWAPQGALDLSEGDALPPNTPRPSSPAAPPPASPAPGPEPPAGLCSCFLGAGVSMISPPAERESWCA